jgi:hypothetical protein
MHRQQPSIRNLSQGSTICLAYIAIGLTDRAILACLPVAADRFGGLDTNSLE